MIETIKKILGFGNEALLRPLYKIVDKIDALGAHLCLYGHTHLPGYEFFARSIILNPGALCGNRTNGQRGFAYLEWQPGGQIYIQMTEL